MWRSIEVNQSTRFIKYDQDQDCYEVYFSDVVSVWMEQLTLSDLSKRCKDMNSLVEAEPDDLAKHIRSLIVDGEEGLHITVNEDGETTKLHVESKLAGIPFYFLFKLKKMNAEAVCKELTVPLMLLAAQQQIQLAKLRDMLIAKDVEIEQYKLEGAVLKKRKVETEIFQENLLYQSDHEISYSSGTAQPVNLFSKLCHLLPNCSTFKGNSSRREVEVINTASEEKHKPEPLTFSTPVIRPKEETATNVKVKQNVVKSKKPKLRF